MRRVAWVYVISVLLSALILSAFSFNNRAVESPPLLVFVILTVITTLMRMHHIVAPDHRSYEGSTIAFAVGFLILPSWLFVLQIVISQGIEWIWVRLREPGSLRAWYLQPFNMAKCIIGGILANLLSTTLHQTHLGSLFFPDLVIVFLMIVTYVAVNQLILGLALLLARGISFREAGIFRDALLLELPLACTGYVAFELYMQNPIEVIFVLAPLVLIYQVFMLPKVQDETMKALEKMNQDLTEANQAINRLNGELFQALAKVFDMRDPYVGGHAAQVATYAVAIATEMGLPPERIEVVRQSAYLHDIGKLAVPEAILHKPRKLTEMEYEFIKKHSDIGSDLLGSVDGLKHLAPFVRHHHERWDGRGYPFGLAGEEIPLEARILNLCDSVETMASDRPYSRAMSTRAIIEEIQRCRGTQFDPAIADIFVKLMEQHGASLIINSARSVTQQYAASLLANESFTQNMFEWILEKNSTSDSFPPNVAGVQTQVSGSEAGIPVQQWPHFSRHELPLY
ncbi:MAG: HD-GYP domain-containing protein [Anaerolineales bacterium]